MRPAFRSKSGSRGKIQLRYVQGRRASSRSQRQTVVVLIASTMSRATATRAISATERRARGRPRSAGRSQASALISTTTRGGKGPRPAASAGSTGGRNYLCELLRWCHVAKGLARTSVEASLDVPKVGRADVREVDALGQVLAEEPIGVLVGAALPGRVWVAEVDGDVGGDGEGRVVGHLGALVPGDGAPELFRQGLDGRAHRHVDGLSGTVAVEVEEEQEPACPLHERPHGGATAFAQDDVALPVARNGTIVCFGRPLGDHDHPRQAPALLRPALAAAGGASGTQTAGELPAQLAAALDEERLVDRLVAHPHLRVVGVIQS